MVLAMHLCFAVPAPGGTKTARMEDIWLYRKPGVQLSPAGSFHLVHSVSQWPAFPRPVTNVRYRLYISDRLYCRCRRAYLPSLVFFTNKFAQRVHTVKNSLCHGCLSRSCGSRNPPSHVVHSRIERPRKKDVLPSSLSWLPVPLMREP